MAPKTHRRVRRSKGSGRVRRLPSGRWQARFPAPESHETPGKLINAPRTFDSKGDAEAWLARQIRDVRDEAWTEPNEEEVEDPTLREYARRWLTIRDLGPRTRADYERLFERFIDEPLGDVRLSRLKVATINDWYAALDSTKPTTRARTYGVLHAILETAVEEDLIEKNPAKVRRGGQAPKAEPRTPATLDELEVIVAALPDRYRLMALLAAWTGLRFHELIALTRADIDPKRQTITVRKGVTRVNGEVVVGKTKTRGSVRTVTVPPFLFEFGMIDRHLTDHVGEGKDALIFPARHGGYMNHSSLNKVWYPARAKAGREDLHFHDLRHTHATLAAQTGATLAELMARLGHTTVQAAMIYQHEAQGRSQVTAERLSDMAKAHYGRE